MSKRPSEGTGADGKDPKKARVSASSCLNRRSETELWIESVLIFAPRLFALFSSKIGPGSLDVPSPSAAAPAPIDMASIRAQIAARMAALGRPAPSGPIQPNLASLSSPLIRPATPIMTTTSTASSTTGVKPPTSLPSDIMARLAAQKQRIAEQQARLANPYLSGSGTVPASLTGTDNASKKGGLSGAMHPLLADLAAGGRGSGSTSTGITTTTNGGRAGTPGSVEGSPAPQSQSQLPPGKKPRFEKTMAPKFTSVGANARMAVANATGKSLASVSRAGPAGLVAPIINPYTSLTSLPTAIAPTAAPDASSTGEDSSALGGDRRPRKALKFSQKGKYIQKGQELRQEQKMEELRQRIAENARKAGLEGEFDTLERSVKRQPPPEVEWWDAPLLKNGTYDDLDNGDTLVRTDDSLVNLFIQHPIQIPAPWQDKETGVRALMLTKKEQKKMRRQRRAADLQDKQDRQKMGLIPPDPPKVRLANIMRVLTSSAVQDPTKVEARVRNEVAQRLRTHEETNAARALTDEQRREKIEIKKEAEEEKGLMGAAFKIKYLVNGAHKFKIKKTAEQLALNGLLIFHKDFALVVVEGSAASMKKYKRLLTVRIDWTEEARPRIVETDGMDVDNVEGEEEDENAQNTGWQAMQERPESLADNRCEVIWEGEVAEKSFRTFRYMNVESDKEAKDRMGLRAGFWDLAKKWIWEDVD